MSLRLLPHLQHDARGSSAVEFALICPMLLFVLLGVMDMGYTLYSNTVLQGTIQKSARDSSLEGATASAIDAKVTAAVKNIVRSPTLAFTRKSYGNFTDVARPEDYTDTNRNGTCDSNEPFEDVNGNKTWDTDRGKTGQGGARDAVLYSVSVTYTRPFPFMKLIGQSSTVTTIARTVLRNQPYGVQKGVTATVEKC